MTGSGNIYIGYQIDQGVSRDNTLIISHSGGPGSLLFGDLSSRRLVVAGTMSANNNLRAFFVNGTAGGTSSWYNDSDRNQKTDIETISYPLSTLMKLRGVTFYWKDPLEIRKIVRWVLLGRKQ